MGFFFAGVECESICDIGRYGTNCQNKCDCGDNRSSCEPQSGKNRLINKNTNNKTKTLTLLYTRRKGSRESIMPPNKKGKNRDHYFWPTFIYSVKSQNQQLLILSTIGDIFARSTLVLFCTNIKSNTAKTKRKFSLNIIISWKWGKNIEIFLSIYTVRLLLLTY